MRTAAALLAVLVAGCSSTQPAPQEPLAELAMIGSSTVLPEVQAGTLAITTHCTGTPGLDGEVRVTRDVTLGVPCAPDDWESTSWAVFDTPRENVRVALRGGEDVTAMRASVSWTPGRPEGEPDLLVQVP